MRVSADTDLRDAFFYGLYDTMKNDPNVLVITADHGAFGLKDIEKDFPDRYFNVGIAEQNAMSVAAGLASVGKTVFIYSIINFITLRCFEQICVDVASMNANVKIVGIGGGMTYSADGPSHHGIQDVAVMSSIPGMQVFNVSDVVMSYALPQRFSETQGPQYVRINKGATPMLYDLYEPFLNGLRVIQNIDTRVIVASGHTLMLALDIASSIKDSFGFRVGVIDLYRVNPINEELLLRELSCASKIITLEDSLFSGGVAHRINSLLIRNRSRVSVTNIALADQYYYHYGVDREKVEHKCGISKERVIKAVIES
jgi:transketolase